MPGKEKKLRILIVSDSPHKQSGFGHQTRDLHRMFTDLGHEVVFFAMHSPHNPQVPHTIMEYEGSKAYCTTGPHQPEGDWDLAEKAFYQTCCIEVAPDIIFLVWDIRKVLPLLTGMDRFYRCPVYLYWLYDAKPLAHQYIDMMKNTKVKILPITKFIQGELDEYNVPYEFEPIPEPVDLARFMPYPEENKKILKRKILGEEHENKFIFGFVGGNFVRKNVPFLIDAFAALAPEIREESLLMLHTDPFAYRVSPAHYDLPAILETYHENIRDKVVFSQANNEIGFNMADVYNVMDVQVSATTGEGFGLCTLEGMACGVPMIIGDISTSREILGDTGWIIPISAYTYHASPFLRITPPDFRQFVTAMIDAWNYRRNALPRMGELAIEQAKKFSMENVKKKWIEFFFQLPACRWKKDFVNEPLLISDGMKLEVRKND